MFHLKVETGILARKCVKLFLRLAKYLRNLLELPFRSRIDMLQDQDFIHITLLRYEIIEKAKSFITYTVPGPNKRYSLLHRSTTGIYHHGDSHHDHTGGDMSTPDQGMHVCCGI
jgi:hypothetical protein